MISMNRTLTIREVKSIEIKLLVADKRSVFEIVQCKNFDKDIYKIACILSCLKVFHKDISNIREMFGIDYKSNIGKKGIQGLRVLSFEYRIFSLCRIYLLPYSWYSIIEKVIFKNKLYISDRKFTTDYVDNIEHYDLRYLSLLIKIKKLKNEQLDWIENISEIKENTKILSPVIKTSYNTINLGYKAYLSIGKDSTYKRKLKKIGKSLKKNISDEIDTINLRNYYMRFLKAVDEFSRKINVS